MLILIKGNQISYSSSASFWEKSEKEGKFLSRIFPLQISKRIKCTRISCAYLCVCIVCACVCVEADIEMQERIDSFIKRNTNLLVLVHG